MLRNKVLKSVDSLRSHVVKLMGYEPVQVQEEVVEETTATPVAPVTPVTPVTPVQVQTNFIEKYPHDEGYKIFRCPRMGVFAGYLEKRLPNGNILIRESRRIWYWDGASSLSELAVKGVSRPQNCKFPCPIEGLHEVCAEEIIPVTAQAEKSIRGVAVWTQF